MNEIPNRPKPEEIKSCLLIGGRVARGAAEVYTKATRLNKIDWKKRALAAKTRGLVVQNPHSGLGVEKTPRRRARFPDLKEERFWSEMKTKGRFL